MGAVSLGVRVAAEVLRGDGEGQDGAYPVGAAGRKIQPRMNTDEHGYGAWSGRLTGLRALSVPPAFVFVCIRVHPWSNRWLANATRCGAESLNEVWRTQALLGGLSRPWERVSTAGASIARVAGIRTSLS